MAELNFTISPEGVDYELSGEEGILQVIEGTVSGGDAGPDPEEEQEDPGEEGVIPYSYTVTLSLDPESDSSQTELLQQINDQLADLNSRLEDVSGQLSIQEELMSSLLINTESSVFESKKGFSSICVLAGLVLGFFVAISIWIGTRG